MRHIKYLLPVVVCTFVYVLLSVMFGQNSIKCYSDMEYQKKIISKQTSKLQNINNELTLELTALKNDKDVIAAYARKLNYVKSDEKIVKINGLKPAQTTLYDTGSVIYHEKNNIFGRKVLQNYCIVFLFTYIYFSISNRF